MDHVALQQSPGGASVKARHVARAALGTLFALAAVAKLQNGSGFAAKIVALFNIDIAGWGATVRACEAIAVLEGIVGALVCISPNPRRWVFLVAICILSFIFWDVARFVAGDEPDCGCFGQLLPLHSWRVIAVKDFALLLLFALAGRKDSRIARD